MSIIKREGNIREMNDFKGLKKIKRMVYSKYAWTTEDG